MKKFRLTALALAGTFASTLAFIPFAIAGTESIFNKQQLTAQRRPTGDLLKNRPVTGTLSNGNAFSGTLSVTRFSYSSGQLLVSGVLNAGSQFVDGELVPINQTFTNVPATLVTGNASQSLKQSRTCDILFLDIGAISLDLLGLTVDLSQIELDINAVSGAGNLLGNLLCALVGLLDGGPLSGILNIIQQINNLLGSL